MEFNFHGDYHCNRVTVFFGRFEFPTFNSMHSIGVKAGSQTAKDVKAGGCSLGADREPENLGALKV